MGVFQQIARPVILAAARSDGLRRTAERMPLTRQVVHRFVAGETAEHALTSIAALRDSHRFVSIDYLGEDVTTSDAADATVRAYDDLLDALRQRGEVPEGPRPLEVSLKLSALGQSLPRDGKKIALENAHVICTKARAVGACIDRRCRGPHHHGFDPVDRARTTQRLSLARNGFAGLPEAHRG